MNLEQQRDSYGWRHIANASACHYFAEDGRSLCRRWACFAKDGYTKTEPPHPDHCQKCEKRLAKDIADYLVAKTTPSNRPDSDPAHYPA